MMYLKIPVINYKYTPMQMDRRINKDMQAEFAKFMADEMKLFLKDVVRTQRFSRFWEPLSPEYLAYKKRNGMSLNIWEATGYLVDSITVRKYKDHYLVGIASHKVYPGTDLRLVQVAKWMEYGTENMPARPLFRRVLLYMRKNVDRYFKRFLKERGYKI